MAQVFHLVGLMGSRRTTVAVLMAQGFAHIGRVCMWKDELGGVSRFDAQRNDFDLTGDENPELADVLFIEHHPDTFDGGKDGDVVMRLEVVKPGALQVFCDQSVDELLLSPAFAASPA